jgi:hypothetical protein
MNANECLYLFINLVFAPASIFVSNTGRRKQDRKETTTNSGTSIHMYIYIYISLEKYQTKSKEEQKKYARWRRVCLLLDGWFSQSRIIAAAHSPQTNSFRSRPPHGFIPYIIQ